MEAHTHIYAHTISRGCRSVSFTQKRQTQSPRLFLLSHAAFVPTSTHTDVAEGVSYFIQ